MFHDGFTAHDPAAASPSAERLSALDACGWGSRGRLLRTHASLGSTPIVPSMVGDAGIRPPPRRPWPGSSRWSANPHFRVVAWIGRQPGRWNHWPTLLIVNDPAVDVPKRWLDAIADLWVNQITINRLNDIKGLEYQHVAIILSADLHHELEAGFTGSGCRIYEERRLLRIPFTRAKDSLAVFVIPPAPLQAA